MKVIHTADWHLGKILNGKQLLQDQAYILQQFIERMASEQPDVIVIAGDLYDTSYPNKEAISLFEQTIAKLNLEFHIPLILISGNHDGKERLKYGANWFEYNNLYIRTSLNDMMTPITINDVNFYTLPYATVSEMNQYFEDDIIETHQQGISKCIEMIETTIDKDKINILVGHLTVQGGTTSDSERPLAIGTVESVDRKTFDIFDFVMLGHLHHPFSINDPKIKYSGSLLQYSFSEVGQAKGYRQINITDKDISEQFIPLSPQRKLEIIEGDYEDIIQENIEIQNKDNYFHFKLTNMSHITDPMMHLKQIYPNTLALTNETYKYNEHSDNIKVITQDDFSIIKQFYKNITDDTLTEVQSEKITNILNQLLGKEENR